MGYICSADAMLHYFYDCLNYIFVCHYSDQLNVLIGFGFNPEKM